MNSTKRTLLICMGVLGLFGCGEGSQDQLLETDPPAIAEGNENMLVSSPNTQVPLESETIVVNLEGTSFALSSLNSQEKKIFLIGAWQLFFPMPADNWGHEFRDTYEYSYWDFSREAREQRYWFTDGEWRLVENEIQVRIFSYRISDRDAEEDVLGFRFPVDTQYISVPVEDDTWHTIGTLESIRTGIVRDGWEFPPRITLHPLRFDRVLEEEYHYYRDRP